MQSKKIGIIGKGRYGAFWKSYFEKKGCEVRASDIGTSPSNEEVVNWAEVVIIAVTLTETINVSRSLSELFRPEQLVMDIASTKSNEENALLATSAEVVGLHPFCAPPTRRGNFRGQTIFVSFARVTQWREWTQTFLLGTEANIEEIIPRQHDLERTVDQVLEHMCTSIKASVMRRLGLNPSRLFEVASPVYKLTAVQMARMYAQSAELYGGIPMCNPFALATLQVFKEEFERYRGVVERKDMQEYARDFRANADYVGAQNIQASYTLSEQIIGLMADLLEKNSMRVVLASDGPGVLGKISSYFASAGINLTVLHSRRIDTGVEFFIAFDRERESPEIMHIRGRLKEELGAKLL